MIRDEGPQLYVYDCTESITSKSDIFDKLKLTV